MSSCLIALDSLITFLHTCLTVPLDLGEYAVVK